MFEDAESALCNQPTLRDRHGRDLVRHFADVDGPTQMHSAAHHVGRVSDWKKTHPDVQRAGKGLTTAPEMRVEPLRNQRGIRFPFGIRVSGAFSHHEPGGHVRVVQTLDEPP